MIKDSGWDNYKKGDYNVYCDRCGDRYKASECRLEWNGLFVCKDCFEIRQPQDFVKAVREKGSVPIARPKGR